MTDWAITHGATGPELLGHPGSDGAGEAYGLVIENSERTGRIEYSAYVVDDYERAGVAMDLDEYADSRNIAHPNERFYVEACCEVQVLRDGEVVDTLSTDYHDVGYAYHTESEAEDVRDTHLSIVAGSWERNFNLGSATRAVKEYWA